MAEYYLIFVILLFIFAVSDLVVGVSNDAVNFLNSAIGSKVAALKTILIVASIGIFIGATFSSGMMEVARKGIFNPQYFQFADVMVIFLAVMLTDIILLDTFNSLGLPTSTTVSIIFELLGAAMIVALIKMIGGGESINALSSYINSSSAIAIISAILTSVAVAFFSGVILQYISRLIFTFNYHKRMKWIGGIWSGGALTLLSYFLFFKGMKGAAFVPADVVSWVEANTSMLFIISFIAWSLLMQILISFFKVNVLRIVVLVGTFSLAMAFAGNDLVNFIGVPIAGFESYKAWVASGEAADAFTMVSLSEAVRTDAFLLLLAGVIMVITLWFSKKARTVTETEVSLGRQNEGMEKFAPNLVARGIVRTVKGMGNIAQIVIPQSWLNKTNSSFEQTDNPDNATADQPAFDLVRAAVNLTVSSALIAFATSLKLPLSTTYVTFMVAMGTSLSDRAWGLDSAVYRVAGVLNVIGGWFLTAVIAFSTSALFAWLIYTFEMWAVVLLVAAILFMVIRSTILHNKKVKEQAELNQFETEADTILPSFMVQDTSIKVSKLLSEVVSTYKDAITGLVDEDRSAIQKAVKDYEQLNNRVENLKKKMFKAIKRIEGKDTQAGRLFLLVYDLEQDIAQSTGFIVETCQNHIQNSHKPVKPEQADNLRQIMQAVEEYLNNVAKRMEAGKFVDIQDLKEQKKAIYNMLENQLNSQIEGIQSDGYGRRNSMLIFSIKLETKDIVAVAHRFVKLYNRLQINKDKGLMLVTGAD